MTGKILIAYFTAMLAVMNPIGNAGIFLGLTAGSTPQDQRSVAWRTSVAVFVILLLMTFAGTDILHFFGLNVSALEAAGGLIIMLIGLHMLQAKQSPVHGTDSDSKHAKLKADIAVVPMALPFIAGPGAMAILIACVGKNPALVDRLSVMLVNGALSGIICAFLCFAPYFKRVLGDVGLGIVTRIMGMILVAMAFMMLASGLQVLLPGLA